MIRKAALLFSVLALVATSAWAAPQKAGHSCYKNPDGRPSITATYGLGTLDGIEKEADVQAMSLSLIYPAGDDLSLLGGWSRSETEWGNFSNWDADMFTVGVRYYFGD